MVFFDPAEGMRPPPFVHSVFTALVVPRPIGWISTVSAGGVVNLAPFSYFNAVTGDPPCVMYCPNGLKPKTGEIKDSVANAEATGEFVFNLCTYDLREQMNATSVHAPADVDEMREAGLEPAQSEMVAPPRVAAAPVALECKHLQTVRLPKSRRGAPNHIVIGQVVGVHISEEVISGGMVDIAKLRPVARLGYLDYAVIEPENVFSLPRPE